jgi:Uma2 family endonuclease
MATAPRVSIEDLASFPDDGIRRYLIRGRLYEMSPVGGRHGEITTEIAALLHGFVKPTGIGRVFTGDTGFVLSRTEKTALGPDIAFVRSDRLPAEEDRDSFLDLAPDLAVEVISPSDRLTEVTEKVVEYLDSGVRLVWVVEPKKRVITAYHASGSVDFLREDDEITGGDVIPGFRASVAHFFS